MRNDSIMPDASIMRDASIMPDESIMPDDSIMPDESILQPVTKNKEKGGKLRKIRKLCRRKKRKSDGGLAPCEIV